MVFFLTPHNTIAQIYDDHIGGGNDVGVTITSSPEQGSDEDNHTLTGTGYFPDMEGAARFLSQATLGASYEDIEYVSQVGIKSWIDEQINMPHQSFLDKYKAVYQDVANLIHATHPDAEVDRHRDLTSFSFYEKVLLDDDVLRNKAAFSLLQIFVVSNTSNRLNRRGYGHASYYDILYSGAFGNFREMLNDVTYHLMMGYYLSHFRNQKGNPDLGTLPDENYAREIMQLFTIGLYELNIDGTQKLDAEGEPIPTYDIEDIQELAKVFTGLSGGAWNIDGFPQLEGTPLVFNRNVNLFDMTVPMIMYDNFHDQGPKTMIDGTVLPADQSGEKDIQDALDILFNHQNVGPFIATRLIQQMVKSNPTPDYVKRVAMVFNNNGKGVRGDMGAVFRAVLLDPEARDCKWLDDAKTGKLRQPIERFTNLFKAFDISSPSGRFWFSDLRVLGGAVEQAFMASPTVFNFFSPFYAEDDYVAPNDMVSPEFQILHAVTAIQYLNIIEFSIKQYPFPNRTRVNNNNPRLVNDNNNDRPSLDLSDEIATLESDGISALLDRLDLLLCQGRLSDGTRDIIQNTLTQLQSTGAFSSEQLVHEALYFLMASADFMILE